MPQTDSTTPLFETERAVSVLLPTAVVGPYDYLVPEEMERPCKPCTVKNDVA